MKVFCSGKCGLHEVKGKDNGVYSCNNCKYCKDKRFTLTGEYVAECKNPQRKEK